MQQLHSSIDIQAPKEKVWAIVTNQETYKQWTEVFSQGSYFEGDWSEGSKMRFLSPIQNKEPEGMVSIIVENRPYEFISIKHLGSVKNGEEDTTSPEAKSWAPALENYTFIEENGETKFVVDMDMNEEYAKYFRETWPKALQKLKELCEVAE